MLAQGIQQELSLLNKQEVSLKKQQNFDEPEAQKNVSKLINENTDYKIPPNPLICPPFSQANNIIKDSNFMNLLTTEEDSHENCKLKKQEKQFFYISGQSEDEPPQKIIREEINVNCDEFTQKAENWISNSLNKSIQLQEISNTKNKKTKFNDSEEEKKELESEESIQNMYFKTQNSEIEKIGLRSQSKRIYEFIIEINLSDYLQQSELTLSELNLIYNDFLNVKQNNDKSTNCKLMIVLIELYYKSYRVKSILRQQGVTEFVMAGYNIKSKDEFAIFVQLPQFSAQKANFEKCKQEQIQILQQVTKEQLKLDQICHNSYILKVYEQFLIEPVLGLVQITETFECDLQQEIQILQKNYTEKQLTNIFFQLINSLVEIHSNDITHLQLNPRNIFKISNNSYKLFNFGRFSLNPSNKANQQEEMKFYSPEQIESLQNQNSLLKMQDKSDIYSMGLTFMALITFSQDDSFQESIKEGQFLEQKIDDPVKLSLMMFVKYYMICKEPKNRFSALKLRVVLLSEFTKEQINREQEYLRIIKLISGYKTQNNMNTNKYLSYLYFLISQLNKCPGNNLNQCLKIAQQIKNFNNQDLIYIQNMYALVLSSEHKFKESLKLLNNCLSQRKLIHKDQLHYDISDSVNSFAISYVTQEEYKMALEQDLKALEYRESLYCEQHPEIIRSYLNVASTYEKLVQHKKALEYKLKALSMREKINTGNHPDLVEIFNSLAQTYEVLGDNKTAQQYDFKAIQMREALKNDDPTKLAQTYSRMAVSYERLGDDKTSLEYKLKALKIRETLFQGNHNELAVSFNSIAITYERLGNYKEAQDYFYKALKIREALYKGKHPDLAESYNSIAAFYSRQGDYSKALDYELKSLYIREILYTKNHSDIAESLNNVAAAYEKLGFDEIAQEYDQQAMKMREALYTQDHPELAQSYSNMGVSYERQRNYQKALEYEEKALNMRQRLYDGDHPDVAQSLNNLGICYERLGKDQTALEFKIKALKMRQNIYKEEHVDIAESLNSVAISYGRLGENQKALDYKLQALQIRQKIYQDNHPQIAASLSSIAVTYEKLGDEQKAQEYDEKAFEMRIKVYQTDQHPEIADSYQNLAISFSRKGDYQRALTYKLKSLTIRKSLYNDEKNPDIAKQIHSIALTYHKLGNKKFALDFFLKALKIRENLFSGDHPDLIESYTSLQQFFQEEGDVVKQQEFQSKIQQLNNINFVNQLPQ